MKKFRLVVFIISSLFVFSSCAIQGGYISNSASLSHGNFSYVNENISGTASNVYFFCIGGLAKQEIVAKAKEDMLIKYPLKSNQTLANITINWTNSYFLIVNARKCTLTADIVEFNSNNNIKKIEKSRKEENPNNETRQLERNRNDENLKTKQLISNQQDFKVDDKVLYKSTFRNIKGIISRIDSNIYYITYINKNNVKKIITCDNKFWITKIE